MARILMPTSLNSSAIRAVDYDPWSGTLDIQFTSSTRWYTFYRVPYSVFQGLVTASSKGSYYNRYIRGRYR